MEMLDALSKRASHLKSGHFDKAEKYERKMTQLKNEKFQTVTTPNTFYYTFKSERALYKLLKEREFELFPGKMVQVKRAKHPSDILHPNRSVKRGKRVCTQVCFAILLLIYSVCFFALFQ